MSNTTRAIAARQKSDRALGGSAYFLICALLLGAGFAFMLVSLRANGRVSIGAPITATETASRSLASMFYAALRDGRQAELAALTHPRYEEHLAALCAPGSLLAGDAKPGRLVQAQRSLTPLALFADGQIVFALLAAEDGSGIRCEWIEVLRVEKGRVIDRQQIALTARVAPTPETSEVYIYVTIPPVLQSAQPWQIQVETQAAGQRTATAASEGQSHVTPTAMSSNPFGRPIIAARTPEPVAD